MHGYRISHGGDLNENKHFKEWTLIIHGYCAYHHIRVVSKLVHIFACNVLRGASQQWSILNSSKKTCCEAPRNSGLF